MLAVLLKFALGIILVNILRELLRFVNDLKRGYSEVRGVKGPLAYPFIKNVPQLAKHFDIWCDKTVEYLEGFKGDKVLALQLPLTSPLFISIDPADIEYALKTKFWSFVKGDEFYEMLRELVGHGIFSVDGELWQRQRKLFSNIFTVSNFRTFFVETFQTDIETLSSILEDARSSGTVVDLHDLFHRYTLDSFVKIAFGTKLDSLRGGNEDFTESFNRAQRICNFRFYDPLWKISEHLTGTRATLNKDIEVIDAFINNIIAQRKASNDYEQNQDLMSLFLSKGFSDVELRDMTLNLTIAGRDTTAQALSWTFFELCQHPEIVEKMKEELSRVIPDSSVAPTYEQLKELTYCKAVFQEVLRLHPSVPLDSKVCCEEVVLPSGTVIKPGDRFGYAPYAVGRSKDVWGQDALEFKPERFLEEPNPSQFKYIVFNAGPRLCLGMNMAYLEALMALAVILPRFNVVPAGKLSDIHYDMALTLPMKEGFPIYVK